MALDPTDMLILDTEREHCRHAGSKLNRIHALGLSETRYYQRLRRLLDDQEAAAYAPMAVNRLRRLRDLSRSNTGRGAV